MELSILLMEQIAKLFLMIFMGYAVVKLGLLTDEDSKVLSTLVLYLIVPSVILNAFQVDYTQEKVNGLKLAGIASLLLLISIVVLGTPKEWNVSRRNFTPTFFFSFLWAAAALW